MVIFHSYVNVYQRVKGKSSNSVVIFFDFDSLEILRMEDLKNGVTELTNIDDIWLAFFFCGSSTKQEGFNSQKERCNMI